MLAYAVSTSTTQGCGPVVKCKRARAGTVFALVLLGGCSSGSPARVTLTQTSGTSAAGTVRAQVEPPLPCDTAAGRAQYEGPSLAGYFATSAGWYEVDVQASGDARPFAGVGDDRTKEHPLVNVKVLRGAAIQQASVSQRAFAGLDETGHALLGPAVSRAASRVVAIRKTTAHIVGNCVAGLDAALQAHLARLRAAGDARTPVEIVRALATGAPADVAELQAQENPPAPTWQDTPPERRLLDPQANPAPPPGLLASLQPFELQVQIPVGLRAEQVTLCTRIAVAWNDCVAPTAYEPKFDLSLAGFAASGAPIEVWLLNGRATLDAPVLKIAVLSPDQMLLGGSGGKFRIPGDLDTLTKLRAAVANGRTAFEPDPDRTCGVLSACASGRREGAA